MFLKNLIQQKSYEHVIYRVHRHFITLVPIIIGALVLFAVPPIVYWILKTMLPGLLTSPVSTPIIVLVGSLYYLSINLLFFSYFIDFYLDMLIVTNDRLVDVEQRGLFSRIISEVDLYQIQDVSSEVHGAFATLFKYGNVTVQSAAAQTKFVVHNVHNPHGLRRAILDLRYKDLEYHNSESDYHNLANKPVNK